MSLAGLLLIAAAPARPDALRPLAVPRPLQRPLDDTGHMLPVLEAWLVAAVCAEQRPATLAGKSRRACTQSLRRPVGRCTDRLRRRLPRHDSRVIDGRLGYADFVAAYRRCLHDEIAARRARP